MLLMIAAALAAAPPVAEPEPAKPRPPKPKLICRESEVQLGSHIRSRGTCKTVEEWLLEDARTTQTIPTMQVTAGDHTDTPGKKPPE